MLHNAFVFATEHAHLPTEHVRLPTEHVHLPTHREGNSFRDSGPGEGPAADALGADGLRRAVHGVTQVPDHHAHRPVSILGQLSRLTRLYPSRLLLHVLSWETKPQSAVIQSPLSLCSCPFQVFSNQLLHQVRPDTLRNQHYLPYERPDPQTASVSRSPDLWDQQVLNCVAGAHGRGAGERGKFLLSTPVSSPLRTLGCNFTAAV